MTSQVRPEVQPSILIDESLDEASRIRALLAGALALRSSELMRGAVEEAYAAATQLIDRLERHAGVAHELARTDSVTAKIIVPGMVRDA